MTATPLNVKPGVRIVTLHNGEITVTSVDVRDDRLWGVYGYDGQAGPTVRVPGFQVLSVVTCAEHTAIHLDDEGACSYCEYEIANDC